MSLGLTQNNESIGGTGFPAYAIKTFRAVAHEPKALSKT
jgi:hypothetical protein